MLDVGLSPLLPNIGMAFPLEWALKKANVLKAMDGIALATAAAYLLYYASRSRRSAIDYDAVRYESLPLPPCLPKKGLAGHLYCFPKSFEYLVYGEWARQLGSDIIHVQLGPKILVILNSWEAVDEILERRAIQYSDRDQATFKTKIVGYDWILSSLPYGERWRQGRTLFRQHMNPADIGLFQPRQLAFAQSTLLPQILELGSSDAIRAVVKHYTSGIAIATGWGLDTKPKDDPYVSLSDRVMDSFIQASTPGRFLVDQIPLLRFVPSWFPGAGWKRQGYEWRKLMHEFRDTPYEAAMKGLEAGTLQHSFFADAMRKGEGKPSPEKVEMIRDVVGVIYAASADTTANAITTTILALLCYPEAQAKAQAELDRVVGPHRLPTFEDKNDLPYLNAVIKEALRWQPPNPAALPHKASEEGEYKGYRIPKGALVIGNVWELMHNEDDYPEPMEFKPERFLNADGTPNTTVRDPYAAIFGFGRRMCPGKEIGLSALWIAIASILHAFTIEKAVDDNGNIIEPELVYVTGFARQAAPFRATYRVRSKEMEELIRSAQEARS